MIGGWHKQARLFLGRHEAELEHLPVACFVTALTLTAAPGDGYAGIPVYVDPTLGEPGKPAS